MTKTRTLIVTLELDCDSLSEQELIECGYFEYDEAEQAVSVDDYEPDEIASLIPGILSSEDVASEMFAGSDIFAKVVAVRVRASNWSSERIA
jgi:hypothetical protein